MLSTPWGQEVRTIGYGLSPVGVLEQWCERLPELELELELEGSTGGLKILPGSKLLH
ncbi:hypothetical protein DACRYDRAFT_23778, partial [Dacryopinax primogenitus]